MTKLVGGCHAVGSSSDALPIILFLSIFIKVLLGIHVGNRYLILDLTNFRAYLISQNWELNFASTNFRDNLMQKKKNRNKAYKILQFCLCFYPEHRALFTTQ